jgi:hypothetical protein
VCVRFVECTGGKVTFVRNVLVLWGQA